MASKIRKIFVTLLIIACSALLTFTNISFALGPVTHKAINNYIAQQSINGFSLNDYLKTQLGLKEGTETYFKNGYLDQQVFKWLGDGGVYEDAGARSLNHFLNPITNKGLLGNYSAPAWATLPVSAQPLSPISSWNDVRSYYYLALTSADKATRENYFARTFQGVGQVMHLVEDMSVPAHTRNDTHLLGDGYERWFLKPTTPAISSYSSQYFTPSDSSFLIPQLFDTDQYNGTNPDITLQDNIGLAEYTNANFFSGDTINAANFPYPKTDNNNKYIKPCLGPSGTYNREYFLKDCSGGYCETNTAKSYKGYLLSAVDFNDYWRQKNPNSTEPKPVIPVLDENVYYDYSQFLIPHAIGYSSQALSYFFRGKLEVEMGDGNLKVKNASADTITGGKFELYYDNANGERNLVTSTDVSTLASGGEQTITFTAPSDGVTSYMLVCSGRLGAEPNAVIGKFIPAANDLVVFTVNLGQKAVSFVWNPGNNRLERAPIDNADANFQAWYSTKKQVADQTNLFGDPNACGISSLPFVNGSQPSACPEITSGMFDTAYNKDVLNVFVGWWGGEGFWACYMSTYNSESDINAYVGSTIFNVLLPQNPVSISGFRTRLIYKNKGVISDGDSVGDGPYYGFRGSVLATYDYTYYGTLGEFGSFRAFTESTGDIIYGYAPHGIKKYYIYNINRKIVGTYSNKDIVNIAMVQILGRTDTHIALGFDWDPGTTTFAFDEARTTFIQAQALYVPEGTTGYDWVNAGRNAALEAQIIAAVDMAYLLNGIPANQIRDTSISIEIVK
jgi:hypothetical protein